MAVFYNFLPTLTTAPDKSLEVHPGGETWEDVRYRLETKHGLHHTQDSRRSPDSYFVGWVRDQSKRTADEYNRLPMLAPPDICRPGMRLVLARKPLRPGMRPHVPQKVEAALQAPPTSRTEPAPVTFRPDMSEEDKILALIDHEAQRTAPARRYQVDYNRPAPADYVCHRCGRGGHWKQRCPTLRDASFKPVGPPRAPTGIPRSFLRTAVTEEEKKLAMRTGDGGYVLAPARPEALQMRLQATQAEQQEEEEEQPDTEDDDMYFFADQE